MISIIIPVFHEEDRIEDLLAHFHNQCTVGDYEIIIVDGDPQRSTINRIKQREGLVIIGSEKGRGTQMNAGARSAKGEILLFLHADTLLPYGALGKVTFIMQKNTYIGGAFDLGVDSPNLLIRFIVLCASLRSRITRVPFGDQAIFIRRDYFNAVGGYKEIPLMEDVDLMKRIRKQGHKIFIIKDRVKTSSRNWEENGIIFTVLRNWMIQILYFLKMSPHILVKFYYR